MSWSACSCVVLEVKVTVGGVSDVPIYDSSSETIPNLDAFSGRRQASCYFAPFLTTDQRKRLGIFDRPRFYFHVSRNISRQLTGYFHEKSAVIKSRGVDCIIVISSGSIIWIEGT